MHLTLVEHPLLTFHWFQDLDLMIPVGSFQLRLFHDSGISAAMLRMCYISFHLSLTCSNVFIMLLSVFCALEKPIILDLRGRPLPAPSHRNLWMDQEQLTHCWHGCVVRRAEGGAFIARAADSHFQDLIHGQAGLAGRFIFHQCCWNILTFCPVWNDSGLWYLLWSPSSGSFRWSVATGSKAEV